MTIDRADVVIVGSGIVGLTLARELAARRAGSILLLEKEDALGRHASGRNSGVLHAGIYYAPDSRKARTCLAGNRAMRAYCAERGLPLLECGKVIVARDEAELPVLDELRALAKARGLWALGHPREVGGGGLPMRDYLYVNEVVGRSEDRKSTRLNSSH